MRIDQMVATYQGQMALRQTQSTGGLPALPGLDGAKRANQARLSDAAKGFVQATKVRDGIAEQSDAVGKARDLVEKAKGGSLSEKDRQQLQADLGKALAAVDQGAKDQSTALADKTLANKTYDATKTTVVTADKLGKGASKQFSSVADLKKLDLNTATPDQLAEAAKVLDAAKGETKKTLAVADSQDGRTKSQVDTFQTVQDALTGNSAANSREMRGLQAIQALSQPSTSLLPGSLFNLYG